MEVELLIDGTPPSLNAFAPGQAHWAYSRAKADWQQRIRTALLNSDLAPCTHIMVEGQMCFPDRRVRDQGNYRYLIEKALGDVLKERWLADDDWGRYSFGNLEYKYEKGQRWTKLLLFASLLPSQSELGTDGRAVGT